MASRASARADRAVNPRALLRIAARGQSLAGAAPAGLRRQLLALRGELLQHSVRRAEAEASLQEALALAEGQPALWASLAVRLMQCLVQGMHMAEAVALRDQVTERLAGEPRPPALLLAELDAAACRAEMGLSRYAEAEATARAALARADQCAAYAPSDADGVRARALRVLGWLAYTRSPENSAQALGFYQQARAAAIRADLQIVANACQSNIATLQFERGELAAARASYGEVLRQAEALADDYGATIAAHNLAGVEYLCGHAAAALDQTYSVMATYERMGDQNDVAAAQQQAAAILMSLGRFGEARAILDQALGYYRDQGLGTPRDLGYSLANHVELLLLEGQGPAALTAAHDALALPGVAEDARLRANLETDYILALAVTGDLTAAKVLAEAGPPDGVGLEITLARQLVIGLVALARGDSAQAAAVAERIAATGCAIFRAPAARLAAAADSAPVPVERLPELLWGAAAP